MHSNANRADHIEACAELVNGRSGRVTSVTVGKMPGRQIIVYDKRAEVIAKRKVGWWTIWNAPRQERGLPLLNSDNAECSRVWRTELRAGKHHLKEQWNIRTWADLDARLGDMLEAATRAIRYARPSSDRNRSRWPDSPLWQRVRRELASDLFEMRSFVDPNLVKQVQRDAYDQMLALQMVGLLTTRAGICELEARDLPQFAISAGLEMASHIERRGDVFAQKLAKVRGRFDVSS